MNPALTRAVTRFVRSPFALAVLGCVVLAGWALWSGGLLDGRIAKEVRVSSVYVASGVDIDEPAAERVIGNRKLVVAFLGEGTDPSDACDDVRRAADGTVVMFLSPGDGEYDHYGCALLGDDDEDFGKKYVAEATVADGVDQFADDPLSAVKVMAVNYDRLVQAGIAPDGGREITPSLPRYLIAIAAVTAVLAGAAAAYLGARRAGRLAADRRDRRDTTDDARAALNARAAVLAQQIIDLDGRYATSKDKEFRQRYRSVASRYTKLVADIAEADERGEVVPALRGRVDELIGTARKLRKG
ncbi:hypothetical protein BLA60_40555 [Actinophytocola xinjiangensis]|uniref:Uncharacterized protein n=1 Tax=Actinophytocola xinjiangensis TaxID=485602 RepID=A0A7Z0WCU6_9PSEU|nr:hypothetical protein [Actinophytocola xinjiangensis]OLF04480.1 hypothetical protein BLA60_40555 [Actinophytocola xinjiangensis]